MTGGADIRTASLVDALAGLVAQDADAVALAQSLDPEIQEIAELAETCAFLSRISDLSEAQCDKVARWFRLTGLEGWGSAGLDRKRAVLAEMVNVYRRRGTRWALERVLGILETPALWDGGDAVWDGGAAEWDSRAGMYSVTERWQSTPADDPHTYRIGALIEHRGLSLDELRLLRQVLLAYVPAREKLLETSETIPVESVLLCAGYPEVGLLIEVG